MAGAIAGAFMNVATSGHCLFVDVVYWVQATTAYWSAMPSRMKT